MFVVFLATYLSCGARGWGWEMGDGRHATGDGRAGPAAFAEGDGWATCDLTTSDIRWGLGLGLHERMDGRWRLAIEAGPAAFGGWMGDERLAMGLGLRPSGGWMGDLRHATSDMRHAIGAGPAAFGCEGMMDGRRATGDMRWGWACRPRGVDGRHATGDMRWGWACGLRGVMRDGRHATYDVTRKVFYDNIVPSPSTYPLIHFAVGTFYFGDAFRFALVEEGWPPSMPPVGPRSMSQSAERMTSRLCFYD